MAAFVWVGVIGGQIEASEQAPSNSVPSPWAGRLAMLAMLSMPLLALWQEFRGDATPSVRHFRMLVSLVAILLLGALVYMKQHLLTRELAVLLERS